jgi:DNA-binding MarR family transcriptional regulator
VDQHDLIEQYLYAHQNINRHIRSGALRGVAPSVTRVQWLILRYLNRESEATIGQLAAHLAVRSSTMSLMIDRLEKTRLVYRSTDPRDARTRNVRLTAEGGEMIVRVQDRWADALSVPFTGLTEEERHLLVQLTAKLAGSLPQSSAPVEQAQVE